MRYLMLACFCFFAALIQAESNSQFRPLDLPSGGAGIGDDEEDAPETVTFYGNQYEGDGFFWCLDKSCSMEWTGSLSILKSEFTEAVQSLTEASEFSVVAFSTGHIAWSPIPKRANAQNRIGASAWVQALQADGATCLADAAITTINISNLSDKDYKNILVLSDGVPTCPGPIETIALVTGANWQRTPINTIYIGIDADGIPFMQSLAAANQGEFSQATGF